MARLRSSDYDDKRGTILKTAATLFARHGFSGTPISLLSEETGGSKAWIYHYYPSKEAILFDLLHTHIRSLLETVRAADDEDADPPARLRGLVVALLTAYEDADYTHRVQMNDLDRLPAGQQEEIRRLERDLVDVFATALMAATPELAGRPDLLKPVTMSLFGMLNWHHYWWRPNGALTLDRYADLAVAMLLDGVQAAVRAVPEGRTARPAGRRARRVNKAFQDSTAGSRARS